MLHHQINEEDADNAVNTIEINKNSSFIEQKPRTLVQDGIVMKYICIHSVLIVYKHIQRKYNFKKRYENQCFDRPINMYFKGHYTTLQLMDQGLYALLRNTPSTPFAQFLFTL